MFLTINHLNEITHWKDISIAFMDEDDYSYMYNLCT